jgi:hypothetical protein
VHFVALIVSQSFGHRPGKRLFQSTAARSAAIRPISLQALIFLAPAVLAVVQIAAQYVHCIDCAQ